MSHGPGWVQMACLWRIRKYEERGDWPTTFNIAADVYQVKPDKDGNRLVNDAQHVAVKRALEGLQRHGRIIGFRTGRARDPGDGRTELCHHWMTGKGLARWIAEGCGDTASRERVLAKAKAIGMKPEAGAENS